MLVTHATHGGDDVRHRLAGQRLAPAIGESDHVRLWTPDDDLHVLRLFLGKLLDLRSQLFLRRHVASLATVFPDPRPRNLLRSEDADRDSSRPPRPLMLATASYAPAPGPSRRTALARGLFPYALAMSGRASLRFDPGVQAWLKCLGAPRDTIRQQLVSRQLAAHLPRHPAQLAVLDAGCGQGTQAIALANLGHDVTGIDISETLLEAAQDEAGRLPGDVRRRLRFERGDVLDLGPGHRERYDVVCCHGVAMYLPSLTELVSALFSATRSGGIVSLLTRNRAGIAMRAGMSREWSAALAAFDAAHYTNRLGIEKVRADDPADVRHAIDKANGETLAWYGVRLFADHWSNEEPAPDIEQALAAEEEAGHRDPYRALAALTHTIATTPPNHQTTPPKSPQIPTPA